MGGQRLDLRAIYGNVPSSLGALFRPALEWLEEAGRAGLGRANFRRLIEGFIQRVSPDLARGGKSGPMPSGMEQLLREVVAEVLETAFPRGLGSDDPELIRAVVDGLIFRPLYYQGMEGNPKPQRPVGSGVFRAAVGAAAARGDKERSRPAAPPGVSGGRAGTQQPNKQQVGGSSPGGVRSSFSSGARGQSGTAGQDGGSRTAAAPSRVTSKEDGGSSRGGAKSSFSPGGGAKAGTARQARGSTAAAADPGRARQKEAKATWAEVAAGHEAHRRGGDSRASGSASGGPQSSCGVAGDGTRGHGGGDAHGGGGTRVRTSSGGGGGAPATKSGHAQQERQTRWDKGARPSRHGEGEGAERAASSQVRPHVDIRAPPTQLVLISGLPLPGLPKAPPRTEVQAALLNLGFDAAAVCAIQRTRLVFRRHILLFFPSVEAAMRFMSGKARLLARASRQRVGELPILAGYFSPHQPTPQDPGIQAEVDRLIRTMKERLAGMAAQDRQPQQQQPRPQQSGGAGQGGARGHQQPHPEPAAMEVVASPEEEVAAVDASPAPAAASEGSPATKPATEIPRSCRPAGTGHQATPHDAGRRLRGGQAALGKGHGHAGELPLASPPTAAAAPKGAPPGPHPTTPKAKDSTRPSSPPREQAHAHCPPPAAQLDTCTREEVPAPATPAEDTRQGPTAEDGVAAREGGADRAEGQPQPAGPVPLTPEAIRQDETRDPLEAVEEQLPPALAQAEGAGASGAAAGGRVAARGTEAQCDDNPDAAPATTHSGDEEAPPPPRPPSRANTPEQPPGATQEATAEAEPPEDAAHTPTPAQTAQATPAVQASHGAVRHDAAEEVNEEEGDVEEPEQSGNRAGLLTPAHRQAPSSPAQSPSRRLDRQRRDLGPASPTLSSPPYKMAMQESSEGVLPRESPHSHSPTPPLLISPQPSRPGRRRRPHSHATEAEPRPPRWAAPTTDIPLGPTVTDEDEDEEDWRDL